jgi:hypothetical protein
MMWALRKWRPYVQGSTVIVVTDHSAIQALTNPKKQFSNRRLANYAIELGDLDVVIAHRAGRVHYMPDWLSRCVHESDQGKLKQLYSQLESGVASVAKRVGSAKQQLLYSTEVQRARLSNQIRQATIMEEHDQAGNAICSVHDFCRVMVEGTRMARPAKAGEMHEPTLLNERYESVAQEAGVNVNAVGIGPNEWSAEDIIKAQQEDTHCQELRRYLETGELPMDSKSTNMERIIAQAAYHTLTQKGVLIRLKQRKAHRNEELGRELEMHQQVVIPQSAHQLQLKIIRSAHAGAGHLGTLKTYQLLMSELHWDGMFRAVQEEVHNCTVCQFHRVRAPAAPMQGHTRAERSGEKLALDVIHLPAAQGHKYLLTAVDVYSRYAAAAPLKTITA